MSSKNPVRKSVLILPCSKVEEPICSNCGRPAGYGDCIECNKTPGIDECPNCKERGMLVSEYDPEAGEMYTGKNKEELKNALAYFCRSFLWQDTGSSCRAVIFSRKEGWKVIIPDPQKEGKILPFTPN